MLPLDERPLGFDRADLTAAWIVTIVLALVALWLG
jgi:hypothetical protein